MIKQLTQFLSTRANRLGSFVRLSALMLGLGMSLNTPVQGQVLPLYVPGASTNQSLLLHKPVKNWQAQRFNDLMAQQTDYSCGAAALATLLRYVYGKPLDEITVINAMLRDADLNLVRTQGFSMLDMKRYVESMGLNARGVQLTLPMLRNLRAPVITLIDTRGYSHFILVKRVIDGQVLIADPALGNRVMPADEFQKSWNGISLAVYGAPLLTNSSLVNLAPPATTWLRENVLTQPRDVQAQDFGLLNVGRF